MALPHAKTVALTFKANYSDGGPVISHSGIIVAYDVALSVVRVYIDDPVYQNKTIFFTAIFGAGDTLGARVRRDGYVEVFRNTQLVGTADIRYWPDYDRTGFIGVRLETKGEQNPAIPELPIALDDFGGGTSLCNYPSPRINVTGIEVTQGIQNLDNDVPMVEGRQTVVRAYIKAEEAGRQTELLDRDAVVLWMYDANTGFSIGPPLLPSNIGPMSLGATDFPRFSMQDSPYFIIPNEYAKGKIKFYLSMNLPHLKNCREQDASPNDCTQQVEFGAVPDLEIHLIPITWQRNQFPFTQHQPTQTDLAGVAAEIKATLPVANVNWSIQNGQFVYGNLDNERPRTINDFAIVNIMVALIKALDGCDATCKTFYYGVMVDPPGGNIGAGAASSGVASGYYIPSLPYPIASHEIGHLAERLHSPCGVKNYLDTSYPFPHGRIEDILKPDKYTRGYFGLDMRTMRILHPDIGDLMGYCHPTWPSAYTYTGIRDFLTSRLQPKQIEQRSAVNPQAPITQTVMIVTGITASAQNTATLAPVYVITSALSPSAPSQGAYTIRLEDKNGQVLSQHKFSPDENGGIGLILPWQAAIAKVSLVKDTVALAARSASAHAPTLRITSPANAITLTWEASDTDGDTLRYAVQYSRDNGATWRTLTANITPTQLALTSDYLPGSSQGMFRVLANDGFHTAQAQSSVIALANRAPIVTVDSVNAEYASGELLLLNGSAYDPEDGVLAGASITWTSSLNGFLGNELPLRLDTGTLFSGTHVFTLTAADGDGQETAMSVTTNISATPFSDIATLVTVPMSYSLWVPSDVQTRTTRMVAIRSASGLPISWTATSNSGWIKVDKASGKTPNEILIDIDASGFWQGTRSGSVTIRIDQTGVVFSSAQTVVDVQLIGSDPRVYLPIIRR
ncbi:MAG: BACON domain-containing protein [Anaerolineae bacterium]|nr:BACON domain-containing protein [Anaerolineae bacterium]